MSIGKAISCRNQVKSYITWEGMTMTEVVELLADEHGSSISSTTYPESCGAVPYGTLRPQSRPMCWAMTSFGRKDNSAFARCAFGSLIV